MKKYLLFLGISFFVMTLFLIGCNTNTSTKTSDKDSGDVAVVDSNDEKGKEEANNEVVSVERFMEFYGVTETDIPRQYILDYLMEWRVSEKKLGKKDYWTDMSNDYNNGVVYGTDAGSMIFLGTASELPIEEYLKDAELIVIEFHMYYGGELYYPRRITLDLKNKKIYYATKLFLNYSDADKCADLSDEDVQSIRDELPKHISDNQGDVTEYNLDYTFEIMMKTPDYKIKGYTGNGGDGINFPGFDAYWKELYKKSFGEEFVFEE